MVKKIKELEHKVRELEHKTKVLKKEFGEKTIGYIAVALGLVASLAWNEAIKDLIEYILPLSKGTILAKFIYAGILTLIVVVILNYLISFANKAD